MHTKLASQIAVLIKKKEDQHVLIDSADRSLGGKQLQILSTSQKLSFQNIKTGLKHVKTAQESINLLLPRCCRSKVGDKHASSEEEQTLARILDTMKTLQDHALTSIVDKKIKILTRALKQELDAERFETQAQKLVYMATAFKKGVKRRLDEGTENKDGSNADDINEQLDILFTLEKKLRSDKEENKQRSKPTTEPVKLFTSKKNVERLWNHQAL